MEPFMIWVCCELYGPPTTIKCSKFGGLRSPPLALLLKVTRKGSSSPTDVRELRAVSCTSCATRPLARSIKAQSQWYLPIFLSTLFFSFCFFSGHFFRCFFFRALYCLEQTFNLLRRHLCFRLAAVFWRILFSITVFILRFALVVLLLVLLLIPLVVFSLLVVLRFVFFTFVVLRIFLLRLFLIVFRLFFLFLLFLLLVFFILLIVLLFLIFFVLLLFFQLL